MRSRQLNLVDAEVYAHEFVMRHSLRRGYKLLFGYYLDNVEEWRRAKDDSLRLPAEMFCERNSVAELRDVIKLPSRAELAKIIRKAGREREIAERYKN